MKITKTSLKGVFLLQPDVYKDNRGSFQEKYHKDKYIKFGIPDIFVQDNFSHSKNKTIRGLHFQNKNPQGKLISCTRGKIFDVIVDIDQKSPTFRQSFSAILSSENHKQIWAPGGYAHGFCVLSDVADVFYKCTNFYSPEHETGIVWNDSTLKIQWPINNPILSEKDLGLPTLEEFLKD